MFPHNGNESENVNEEIKDFTNSSFTEKIDGCTHEPVNILSSSQSPSSEDTEDEDNRLTRNPSNQLALYEPKTNIPQEIGPIRSRQPSNSRFFSSSKVLPSIGAFTVQCAKCFKWRLIPTKQKYEEIREHILEKPFSCEIVREWRPEISCDDPTDISQDGSRLWAIDKPNIAQPPPGWQRLLRIRGEGSTKFADVYYQAPSGKRLRSMVEVQKYLTDHPQCLTDGVTLSQFSFQIPRPLQENYVRKRPAKVTASRDNRKTHEPTEVTPLAWSGPEDAAELQLGVPGLPPPFSAEPAFNTFHERPKKMLRESPSQNINFRDDPIHNGPTVDANEPGKSRSASEGGF